MKSLTTTITPNSAPPRVLASVARGIGEEAIRASKGTPFNDIPLAKWDRLVGWDCPHVRDPLVGHARLALSGEDSSLSTHVCIAKTAAAIIKKAQTP